ncbi:MAG: queuosine precursor transporter [Planctomycetaceae bacterium]|nr:queuosine precursor transporter [Planctomycetaceae bacterium]
MPTASPQRVAPDRTQGDAPDPVPAAVVLRRERAFAFATAAFAVVLVLTNVIGVKLFALFPDGRPSWMPGSGALTLTTGIISYPLTFLLTDLVSEIWGRKRADFMVLVGFAMSLLMLVLVSIARALPPSDFWTVPQLGVTDSGEMQRAFEISFYNPQILLFASMAAYLVAQLFDVRLYHFWWRLTKGRHMWLRNNGSTLISQLVDTAIVNGIFLRFALDFSWSAILEVIVAVYLVKVVLALLDTPLIYAGRAFLRRFLSIPDRGIATRAPLA